MALANNDGTSNQIRNLIDHNTMKTNVYKPLDQGVVKIVAKTTLTPKGYPNTYTSNTKYGAL